MSIKDRIRAAATLSGEQLERLNPPTVDAYWVFDTEPEHVPPGATGMLLEAPIDDPRWLPVGYIPTPTTVAGWFFYHLIHGIAMRYPLWKALLYALVESPPLEDEDEV